MGRSHETTIIACGTHTSWEGERKFIKLFIMCSKAFNWLRSTVETKWWPKEHKINEKDFKKPNQTIDTGTPQFRADPTTTGLKNSIGICYKFNTRCIMIVRRYTNILPKSRNLLWKYHFGVTVNLVPTFWKRSIWPLLFLICSQFDS